MSEIIWLPDEGATTTVEWYITEDKKATGIESLRQEWRPVPVRDKRTGFAPSRDKRE